MSKNSKDTYVRKEQIECHKTLMRSGILLTGQNIPFTKHKHILETIWRSGGKFGTRFYPDTSAIKIAHLIGLYVKHIVFSLLQKNKGFWFAGFNAQK